MFITVEERGSHGAEQVYSPHESGFLVVSKLRKHSRFVHVYVHLHVYEHKVMYMRMRMYMRMCAYAYVFVYVHVHKVRPTPHLVDRHSFNVGEVAHLGADQKGHRRAHVACQIRRKEGYEDMLQEALKEQYCL